MSEETKLILEMLREGRVSADEAANLLQALNPQPQARETLRQARSEAQQEVRSAKAQMKEELRRVKHETRAAVREAREKLREASLYARHFERSEEHNDPEDHEDHEDHGRSRGLHLGLGALIGGLTSGLSGTAYSWEEKLEGELPQTDVARVIIRGVNGRIKIEPAEQGATSWTLLVEKTVRAITEKAALAASEGLYSVQGTEQGLFIEAKKVFGQTQTVNFHLLLPPERIYVLETDSTNGSIDVRNLPIKSAKATTTNGKVRIEGDGEEFVLGSTNGRLEMVGCAKAVKCRTVNGRIAVECMTPQEGILELSTVNGSISILTGKEKGLGIRFRGETMAGSVKTSLHRQEILSDERRRVGRKLVVQRASESGLWLDITAKSLHGSITLEEV